MATVTIVPLYAELVSFGTFGNTLYYAFTGKSSSIKTPNRKRRRQYAYALGQADPIDLLAGGRPQRDNPESQWTYHVVVPDGTTSDALGAYYVEHEYNKLEAFLNGTNDDGTDGSLQTLAVNAYKADGTFQVVTAPAALVDVDYTDVDRGPFYCPFTLTFTLFGPFTYTA